EVQQKIKDIDNNPALYNSPFISDELRRLAKLDDPKKDNEELVIKIDKISILLEKYMNDGKHNSKKSDIKDDN
ncbi:5907_t:CDS:1, partial [Funneliformis geosporum]